jgi:ferredoxin
MMAEVKIDEIKCIGCFNCVHVCDETFRMPANGDKRMDKAVVKRENVEKVTFKEEEAKELCPTEAISISE